LAKGVYSPDTYVTNAILHVTLSYPFNNNSGFKNMKLELAIMKSLVLALCLLLAACAGEELIETNNSTATQCADGIDNDGDGLTDLNDSGCSDVADNNESDDPVSTSPNAARANSYDDPWESAWIARVKTILSTPVPGITKTDGKVLQVGDSMTYSFAYGDWARHKTGATASDLETINWMHAGAFDTADGWKWSSDGVTAMNNAGWGWGFVDNIFVDPVLNDAQFAVVMFNVNDITFVKSRINEFIAAGIVPVLSTIPPRTDLVYNRDKADPYNLALYALAEELSLPLIDFSKEILLRRPNGTWEKTLIGNESGTDGVHPSGGVNGYSPISDPYADGGDASTHTTGNATLNSGYLLRTWLTVQKMKEIKQKVID
jgi:hypothetical protein